MKKIFCLIAIISLTLGAFSGEAQNYNQRSKQRAREKAERAAQEYEDIIDEWDLSEYKNFLNSYPNSKRTPEIKSRVNELESWEKACRENTIEAYKNYLSKSSFMRYEDEAHSAIEHLMSEEIDNAWASAQSKDSIEEYEKFIDKYPNCSYVAIARERIDSLKADAAWEEVESSFVIAELQNFIDTYPSYPNVNILKVRIKAINGLRYYTEGDLERATTEFAGLELKDLPDVTFHEAYNATRDINDFKQLSVKSSMIDLEAFKTKYPESKYINDVNNYIALQIAGNFNLRSGDTDYQKALSFATGETVAKVQSRIASNEEKKRIEEIKAEERRREQEALLKRQQEELRRQKAYKRKQIRDANGGLIRLGIEYVDFNVAIHDPINLMSYNLGLKFQVGNNMDRIQAGVAIKAGVLGYFYEKEEDGKSTRPSYYDDDKNLDIETRFVLPLEFYTKINLFRMGVENFCFLQGQFTYNAVGDREFVRPCAWGAGLGISGKNWNWTLYYKREIGDYTPNGRIESPQNYIGTSVNYFFKLY